MPIPDETRDRWDNRAEPESGKGAIYWHILFRDNPAVRATAKEAQARLASFRDLHMTPVKWLHATALVAGTTDDISSEDLDPMLSEARQRLSRIQPIGVTISRVLYHPEAIMLGFTPEGALDPIHHAVRQATLTATGRTGSVTGPAGRWAPHMTIAYSTGTQPMAPIAAALGHEVPRCDITVKAVSLVIQWGPERVWNWQPVGEANLGSELGPATVSDGDPIPVNFEGPETDAACLSPYGFSQSACCGGPGSGQLADKGRGTVASLLLNQPLVSCSDERPHTTHRVHIPLFAQYRYRLTHRVTCHAELFRQVRL